MKVISPHVLKGGKVYYTDADHAAQRRLRLSRRTLEEKLKLLCTLNDYVVIATSHIFESPSTYQVVLRNRLLLESGVIVPALRDICRDFYDFIEQQQLEQPERKCYGKQGWEIAHFLHSIADMVVSWRLQATQENFRESLLRDLSASVSLFCRELGLLEEQYQVLLRQIQALERISREEIHRATQGFSEAVRLQLFRFVDLNYYLAGASAVESDPVVGALQDVRFTRDKVERAFIPYERLDSDVELFRELLASLDVPVDILSRLTDRDIMRLRQDSAVGEFRRCYRTIVEKVRQSLPEPTTLVDDARRLAKEAKRIMGSYVRDKVRQEVARERSAHRIAKAIQLSGFATALMSILSLPLLPQPLQVVGEITGTVGTALQLADPLLQKILVEPRRGELILFATRLQEFARK